MIHDLLAGRDLTWRLAVRDISAQYRQMQLGLIWAFIIPLATTLTWIFLNGSGVVPVGDTPIPYPVYVFTGTMLWALFTQALNGPITQCTNGQGDAFKTEFFQGSLDHLGHLPDDVQWRDQDRLDPGRHHVFGRFARLAKTQVKCRVAGRRACLTSARFRARRESPRGLEGLVTQSLK